MTMPHGRPAPPCKVELMNELFITLGISDWKPVLSTLLLPPVPLFVLLLLGAGLVGRRRSGGWALVSLSTIALWAMCTSLVGQGMIQWLTNPPPALTPQQVTSLARAPRTAIVVLGAGQRYLAREYATADLKPMTIERLRYGVWLAKQTNLPLAYSGGLGRASRPGATEAEIARRVVERDFGMRLRWAENKSRDTHENAIFTVAMLRDEGIQQIVLVTHDFHQQRALAAFQRAIDKAGVRISVVPAPMGLTVAGPPVFTDFLPTAEGFAATRLAFHEWVGRLAGA